MGIAEKITKLKNDKNAVILAHYYQRANIQDVADYVGDSYGLSRMARDNDAKTIVFCGVKFMAESAKILSPEKKVLLPVMDAGCPMADMVTEEDVLKLREEYPEAEVVCYVNSSAEVKAVSDVCCTSSNAVKIVKALARQIIFVPDENLGRYVAQQVPEKEIILFPGYCIVHKALRAEEIDKAKAVHPDALFLVHPECTKDVIQRADFIGSTAQILAFAKESKNKKFIIGTEQGILHKLQQDSPEKRFYLASPRLHCLNMKKTYIEDVLNCLKNEEFEINIDKNIMERAKKSLDRMLELS